MIINTYTCLECGIEFDEPHEFEEHHGLDSPPFEKWCGCPACGSGAYMHTHLCDHCGAQITGVLCRTADGGEYCESCFQIIEF